MVLFINSHCDPLRMDFIRRLRRHINVDVYGRCAEQMNPGIEPCPRNSNACRKLQSRYRFYLAFENSFCRDYITEKYFKNGLLRGLIPIVIGAANYSDSRIAVPGSFIDAGQFESLEALAKFLVYVSSDDEIYNSFFRWRTRYQVGLRHGMCKLCKALWEDKTISSEKVNLKEFWDKEENCWDTKEYLKRFFV